MDNFKKKDVVYYTRIIPASNMYDVLEMKIRTIEDNWFVGIEKRDKQAYLFHDYDINKIIFANRKDAVNIVKEAEKNKKIVSEETDYQEF